MIGARANAGRALAKSKSRRKSVNAVEETIPFPGIEFKYVRPRKDPTRYRGCLRSYVLFTNRMNRFVQGDAFSGFIIAVIVLAGVLVGVQTYDLAPYPDLSHYTLQPSTIALLDGVDVGILTIFVLEALVKIVAEGLEPWRYFVGPEWRWNVFDFLIVLACLPIWPWGDSGGSIALLRVLRLMRVVKLIKKIPQLQMIVVGLIGGLRSISYISLLLFLVFYVCK